MCAFLVLSLNFLAVSNDSNWVNNLVRYMKKDLKVFQIVLVIDDDVQSQDSQISSILGKSTGGVSESGYHCE